MKPVLAALTLLAFALPPAPGQEADAGAMKPAKRERVGYLAIKVETLPRDANGQLTPEVWEIIKAEAEKNPNSNEARILQSRPTYKAWYANYAKWKPPELPPLPEGKLRNLPETPKEPRFPLTDKAWPARVGEASVCLWEDDKLAAMSFGVDDNCAGDLAYWKELSRKYGGVNITWNLITANIDGAIEKGRMVGAGTWETWRQMVKEGYHVASHSMTHLHDPVPADGWPGPDWEAAESQRMIAANIPGFRARLFAYPGAGVHAFAVPRDPATGQSAWRPTLVKYYAAARSAGYPALNQANMIDYFDIHATTGSVPYILGNSTDPRFAAQDLHNLFAADPKHPHHKFYRGWANLFIHFINGGKTFDTDPYTVAYGKALAFYNEHRADLWTGFIDDIALYGQERDTASLRTDEASDSRIAFTLTSKMDPSVFDYPLTVKVRLPDSWKTVRATQKDAPVPASVLVHEGAPYALVKAVPDRGTVTLAP